MTRSLNSNYRHLQRLKKCAPVKKPPESSSDSSSSVTPTDDLLQEAKTKLRNLEVESENIDRRFRSFTERYDFAASVKQCKLSLCHSLNYVVKQ